MNEKRRLRGHASHKRGHFSEYIALAYIMLKGYRILGFRLKTPHGEIDILAMKGKRLALIEVKQRRTLLEAQMAVSERQQHRLWQAGQKLQAQRASLRSLELGLDLCVMAPGQMPLHIENAFEGVDG